MNTHRDILDAIGNTPLIRLRRVSEATGCEILGKAEFMNPGQSVKDRAALAIIRDAEAKGLLKPGGVIVEGTAGNTGIGLALVANAKGYKTIIVMPETQSREKMDTLRALGPFDAEQFLFFEDLDLCLRARAAGATEVRTHTEELTAALLGWPVRTIEAGVKEGALGMRWAMFAFSSWKRLSLIDEKVLSRVVPQKFFYNVGITGVKPR